MVLLWGEGTLNKPDRVGYISHKRVPPFHLGYASLEVNFSYVLLFFVGRMIRIQIESYDSLWFYWCPPDVTFSTFFECSS